MCIECRRVLFPLSTFHVGMHIDHTIISTNSSNFICFAWPDFDRSLSAFPRFANLFWRTNDRAPLPLSRLAFPLIRTRPAAALHWRHTTEPVGWPPGSRGSWLWRIQFERWNFSNTHRPTHLPTYRAARGYQFRCRRTGLLTRFEWVLDAWSKGKYSPEIQFRRMEIVFRQHFSSRSRARCCQLSLSTIIVNGWCSSAPPGDMAEVVWPGVRVPLHLCHTRGNRWIYIRVPDLHVSDRYIITVRSRKSNRKSIPLWRWITFGLYLFIVSWIWIKKKTVSSHIF